MIVSRHTNASYDVSYLDLLLHGSSGKADELVFTLDRAQAIAQANANIRHWSEPGVVEYPELAFLRDFRAFVEDEQLARPYDHIADVGIPPPFHGPLLPNGTEVVEFARRRGVAIGEWAVDVPTRARQIAAMTRSLLATEISKSLRLARADQSAGRFGPALARALRVQVFDPDDGFAAEIVSEAAAAVSDRLPAIEAPWLDQVDAVDGWLRLQEAELLARCVAALDPDPSTQLLEIGSYKGRSTVAIGLALRSLGSPMTLTTVDPHTPYMFGDGADTYESLTRALAENGITDLVKPLRARSTEVNLDGVTLSFAFLDGMHEAAAVQADYRHVAPHLAPGAILAFHDCMYNFPGVIATVQDLLLHEGYELIGFAGQLVVLRTPAGT